MYEEVVYSTVVVTRLSSENSSGYFQLTGDLVES